MKTKLEIRSQHRCFGGMQSYYQHHSETIGLPMRFSVYVPPEVEERQLPVLFFLAGLTCTEETFMIKAGAQRYAAELGIILVSMDTSPRNTGILGEADDWEFGSGAGFYLDATEAPWSRHFHMESYITRELHAIILDQFPVDPKRVGIFGHSMGGHGALTLALRHKHDATALIESGYRLPAPLIDQGLDDPFLAEQLHPSYFEAACQQAEQPVILRRHAGYDHSYFFISTFIEDHLRHHHALLTLDQID